MASGQYAASYEIPEVSTTTAKFFGPSVITILNKVIGVVSEVLGHH